MTTKNMLLTAINSSAGDEIRVRRGESVIYNIYKHLRETKDPISTGTRHRYATSRSPAEPPQTSENAVG